MAEVAAGATERVATAKEATPKRGSICSVPGTRCCGGSSGRRGMGATAAVPGRWLSRAWSVGILAGGRQRGREPVENGREACYG